MSIDVIRSKIVIAGLSYVKPVFTADYLQVRVVAEVTMPDVLNVDIVTPVDLVSLSTVKALVDTTNGFSDLFQKTSGKGLTDVFTMTDSIDIEYWIEKKLADIQTLSDTLTSAFAKGINDDTNGFVDTITAKAINKALSDSVSSLPDSLASVFTKQLTDTTNPFSDSLITALEKALADTQAISESIVSAVSKPLFEAIASLDTPYLSLEKALADTLSSPSDAIQALDFGKGLADSSTITESIETTLIFIRDVADTLNSADSPVLLSSLPKDETLTSTDTPDIVPQKGVLETLNLIDNMDGDIEYSVIKLIGELLSSSDAQFIAFANELSDNVVTSSSGVLAMQDYCDITYFLEDYVGTSRTFT